MKKQNTKKSADTIAKTILFAFMYIVVILGVDFLDLPSKMGIPIDKINIDIQSLVISNVIVIAIFVITYFLIDRRGIEREKKQKECALIFLNETFNECIENVDFVENEDFRYAIVKKCNFNISLQDDKVFYNYYTLPFKYDDYIFEAANNGQFSKDLFTEYLTIKNLYQKFILSRISFFDAEKENKEKLCNEIKSEKNELLCAINSCKEKIDVEVKICKQPKKDLKKI